MKRTTKSNSKSKSNTSDSVHANWHLGRSRPDIALTEFELVMLRFQQAFERWALHVTARCGDSNMSFVEAVLLHAVRIQDQPSSAQSISRLLNRDDIANVQYSLRKLVKRGYLVHAQGSGKNVTFAITDMGRQLTDYYAEIRHTVLVAHSPFLADEQIQTVIDAVGMLTGQYDEAVRKAATYHFDDVRSDGKTSERKALVRPKPRAKQ